MRRGFIPMALFLLVLRPCWSQQTEKFSLRHARAEGVADWMRHELEENGELAGMPADQIDEIAFVRRDNLLLVSAEKAAIQRMRVLIEALDVPITRMQIECMTVELNAPELLLSDTTPVTTVELRDGSTVELPSPEMFGPMRRYPSGWSGAHTTAAAAEAKPALPQDETAVVLAVNAHVDASVLANLLDSGRATIVHQPRIVVMEGQQGLMAFGAWDNGEGFGVRLGFAAAMTDDDLITVQASLHWDEPAEIAAVCPNLHIEVMYTALPGQTVAVGLLPKDKSHQPQCTRVFLITARVLD